MEVYVHTLYTNILCDISSKYTFSFRKTTRDFIRITVKCEKIKMFFHYESCWKWSKKIKLCFMNIWLYHILYNTYYLYLCLFVFLFLSWYVLAFFFCFYFIFWSFFYYTILILYTLIHFDLLSYPNKYTYRDEVKCLF